MAARNKKKLVTQDTVNQVTADVLMEVGCSEINAIADLPEALVSDGAATEDAAAEPIVNLDATLTIQNVAILYEKLKKSYSANNAIEVDASQVSSIDTASLQLLVALKKDALKQQKEVVFAAPSLRFIESAKLLGLLGALGVDA
jgi:anti-anti-sigma regulatory factor